MAMSNIIVKAVIVEGANTSGSKVNLDMYGNSFDGHIMLLRSLLPKKMHPLLNPN